MRTRGSSPALCLRPVHRGAPFTKRPNLPGFHARPFPVRAQCLARGLAAGAGCDVIKLIAEKSEKETRGTGAKTTCFQRVLVLEASLLPCVRIPSIGLPQLEFRGSDVWLVAKADAAAPPSCVALHAEHLVDWSQLPPGFLCTCLANQDPEVWRGKRTFSWSPGRSKVKGTCLLQSPGENQRAEPTPARRQHLVFKRLEVNVSSSRTLLAEHPALRSPARHTGFEGHLGSCLKSHSYEKNPQTLWSGSGGKDRVFFKTWSKQYLRETVWNRENPQGMITPSSIWTAGGSTESRAWCEKLSKV